MDTDSQSRLWFAAYTRSRHEHSVAAQLQQKGVEHLLPTYERVARWSDRVKRSRSPLFPGYVFIHVGNAERVQVLQTDGVVGLVSRAGKAVPLFPDELELLRVCCSHAHDIEPHPYLKVSQRVRVRYGPFCGWEGTLLEKQNSRRLVVGIEQIMKAVAINIDAADVEAL